MVTLSQVYLGFQCVVCSVFAYFMLFDAESFLKENYNMSQSFDSELGMFALSMCRFWGSALVVFAFLYGHVIPFPSRHGAVVRTALMLDVLIFSVSVYDAYFEPKNTAALVSAAEQNVYLEGFFVVLGVLTLAFGLPAKDKKA